MTVQINKRVRVIFAIEFFWALKMICIYTCSFLHKGTDLHTSISRAVPAPTAIAQMPMISEFQF